METIKSSTEVSFLFEHGKRIRTPYSILIVLPHEQHGQTGRAAFIAGKKLGNAVWRNKAKRRLRAICRDLGGPWEGYDVIFQAKAQTTHATYSKVLNACKEALAHEGILSSL